MLKKLIGFGIAIVLLFSLAACNTDFDLAKYKADAKVEIASYVTESNYCLNNWRIVCGIVDTSKATIDLAENKSTVDTAVKTAKEEIDEVFSYTKDNPQLRSEIDRLYYKWFESANIDGVALEEIARFRMDCYYGQYNSFYIFHFTGWGFSLNETIIDGLTFKTHNTGGILAVKEDCAGTLKEIYENGYISRADLEAIHEINLVYWILR